MKISDFILRYRVGYSIRDAICRVRIFLSPSNQIVVVLGDLGDKNTGASVTNSIEVIRDTIAKRGFVVQDDAVFMEHYEWETSGSPFTLVTFDQNGDPEWDDMSASEAVAFLGCSTDEFSNSVVQDERLSTELARIRNDIAPFFDSPELESAAVYNRRAEIAERMISKGELSALVDRGAGERELQSLLKRDLSIFAELYARPREEYICFSEFPVADGFVDFAVFGGRSRMDVILIEVKGAEFYFLNRSSYRNFASKINEAVQQVRRRMGKVYRQFDDFRQTVHRIRANVESGIPAYSSFVGPQTPLEVDPNKDVRVRAVVIGGRTRDDISESRLRHDFEHQSSPPVIVESWNSWLRKLERD